MPNGIIIKGIGGFYYVKDCERVIECKARGKFRNSKITPLVGDRVKYQLDNDSGLIVEIEERKNSIIRPPAANIDQVIIVIAAKHPTPNLMFVDKMIAMFESKSIKSIICVNKIDLDEEKEFKKIYDIYKSAGYDVICTSAKKDDGIEDLAGLLKGQISAFSGSSGVGKSTLLNVIMKDVIMETGELSSKIERGKHTTRHVEIFELNHGGYILDTPGFSSFEVTDLDKDELKYLFNEFKEYNHICRFTGCSHINEPDCAVKQSVLEGIISTNRYENYKTIFNELKLINRYK